ncbi:caspase family protein, partial [Microcoleus sp. POL10_C6]
IPSIVLWGDHFCLRAIVLFSLNSSYYLLKALREYGTEIPVNNLYDRISNLVHNDFQRQTPMLIGETNRTFLGGQSVVASRNPPVMKVDITKNRVQLQMGEASGLKKGAEFDIFRFGTRNFEDSDNRIATVKVVEVGASDCWAEVTMLHNEFITRELHPKLREGIIEIGSPAVYLSPGLKQIRKIRILLPSPLPQIPGVNVAQLPVSLQNTKKDVEGHRWIEFCSEDEKDENVDYFVSLNSEGEYWILDGNKEPIKSLLFPIKADEPKASENLINRFIHIARYESILELDNEDFSASLNGKIKVELIKSVKRKEVVLNADGQVPVLESGEKITLRIYNESKRVLNISALILQADLSIVKFYPEGITYEPVDPGSFKETKFDMELPENYEEGVDVIKVFATVDATNFELLELPPLDQPRPGIGDKNPTTALGELLVAVVDEDNPQRNIRVVTDASEEWTTEKVEVVVKKSVV